MDTSRRVGALFLLVAGLAANPVHAQSQKDTFRWYIGAQGGVTIFETPLQTNGSSPTAGLHALIVAKRVGLDLEFQQSFGSDEQSALSQSDAPNGYRTYTFNDVRQYSFTLMALPIRGKTEFYVGVGASIIQTVNPQPVGPFIDSDEQQGAINAGRELGSYAAANFVGGLQYHLGLVTIFGQYKVTTSPNGGTDTENDQDYSGLLLKGANQTIVAGLRFDLGHSREPIN